MRCRGPNNNTENKNNSNIIAYKIAGMERERTFVLWTEEE